MDMGLHTDDSFFFFPSSLTKLDDALMKRIFISHDPDNGRVDSEQLLDFTESILLYDASSQSSVSEVKSVSDFELIAAQEPLGEIISKASHYIICTSSKEQDLMAGVLALFDLLGHYRWDAKVVLVLAAFAIACGNSWLLIKLRHQSQLAASVADLRQISKNSNGLQHRLKAMRSLFNILINLARSIVRFCALPMQDILLDDEIISLANSKVHAAVYWVIRSTLQCSTRILHLVSMKSEASSATMWELARLSSRLCSISNPLKQQLETCSWQIELELNHRLKNLQSKVYPDNQEALRLLLGIHDDFPLMECASKTKPKSLSKLKNKVVLLLVSTPDFLPVQTVLLLSEKLYNPKLNDRYEVVWIPIPQNSSWSEADMRCFKLLSNYMPWSSIRRPWLLNRAAVEYIKQTWDFKGQAIMPVLDTLGGVANSNVLDMALVWGPEAFPFSDSREFELWKAADLTLEFLLNGLDPLVSTWIEEGKNLCILGGNDAEWIGEVSTRMKNMINAGLQIKVIFVGARELSQIVTNIFKISNRKNAFSVSLPVTRLEFFWLRLESLRRSKIRTLGANTNDDMIMHQLQKLLDLKCCHDGWAVMGMSKDGIKVLQGREVTECLTTISSNAAAKFGLPGAVESAAEFPPQPGHCNHFKAVAYSNEPDGRTMICSKCQRPMEIFFIV